MVEYDYVIGYDQVTLYALNGLIDKKIAINGYREIYRLKDRVDVVIRNSGLPYPPITVIPEARILMYEPDFSAIVYADLNYRYVKGYLHPYVEISLPFLLYAPSELKSLVLAHEFLHYIYMAIRYVTADYLINPLIYTGELTGRELLEDIYTVSPFKVFTNKRFASRVEKIGGILESSKISDLVKERWIDRGMPSRSIDADEFRVKLTFSMWREMFFPEEVLRKARMLSSG